MITEAEVQVKPEFSVKSDQFYACDGSFQVNEFQRVSCGARSYYFALVRGVQLSYCGHHANKFEVGLLPIATKIIDHRHLILPDKNPAVD